MWKPLIVKKVIDDKHYYFVDGEFYPSVTTILSEAMPTPYALRQWIGDVGNEKAELKMARAAERGSAIHSIIERFLLGEEITDWKNYVSERDQKTVMAAIKWLSEFKPVQIKSEQTVASQLGFAGTLDLYAVRHDEDGKEEHWIIDFKTSSSIHDSHKLQVAAYKKAFMEMYGVKVKTGILHLNSTIKGYTFYTDLKIGGKLIDSDDFLKVFEVYKMLNGGNIPQPPEVEEFPDVLSLKDYFVDNA